MYPLNFTTTEEGFQEDSLLNSNSLDCSKASTYSLNSVFNIADMGFKINLSNFMNNLAWRLQLESTVKSHLQGTYLCHLLGMMARKRGLD